MPTEENRILIPRFFEEFCKGRRPELPGVNRSPTLPDPSRDDVAMGMGQSEMWR